MLERKRDFTTRSSDLVGIDAGGGNAAADGTRRVKVMGVKCRASRNTVQTRTVMAAGALVELLGRYAVWTPPVTTRVALMNGGTLLCKGTVETLPAKGTVAGCTLETLDMVTA
jgi:hypothetical protein